MVDACVPSLNAVARAISNLSWLLKGKSSETNGPRSPISLAMFFALNGFMISVRLDRASVVRLQSHALLEAMRNPPRAFTDLGRILSECLKCLVASLYCPVLNRTPPVVLI